MAAGQGESAEVWSAAGEPVEAEVREVAQVGQVQLLQTRQSRPHLQQEREESVCSEINNRAVQTYSQLNITCSGNTLRSQI